MYKPSTEVQERLDGMVSKFEELSEYHAGYPCTQNFDYSALAPFLQYAINNVGDPFHGTNFASNTHDVEREVIA